MLYGFVEKNGYDKTFIGEIKGFTIHHENATIFIKINKIRIYVN